MGEFLSAILAFPTAIFTALFGVVLLYWLVVLLGLLDVDALDPTGMIDAGVDAALDAVGGEGADVGDAGDVDAGDADAGDAEAGSFAKGLQALGLVKVPLTLSISLLIFFAWILCFLGMRMVRGSLPPSWLESQVGAAVIGTVIGVAAVILAMLGTTLAVRPLVPVFATRDAPRRRSFVGKPCTIISSRVDASFGQAEIEDGGGGLRVDVRCFDENTLGRGSKTLVYDYDAKQGVFHVSASHDALEEGD